MDRFDTGIVAAVQYCTNHEQIFSIHAWGVDINQEVQDFGTTLFYTVIYSILDKYYDTSGILADYNIILVA